MSHRRIDKDVAKEKCDKIYNDLGSSLRKISKHKRLLSMIFICLILFSLFSPFILNPFFSFKWSIFLYIFGIILILYLLYQRYKKYESFRISNKEILIYLLCKIAVFTEAFANSNTSNKEVRTAIKYNSRLQNILNSFLADLPDLFVDRGFKFDKNLLEFLDYLRTASKNHFSKILESKKDITKLLKLSHNLRNIALIIEEEDFMKGIKFIQKDMKILKKSESKLTKFFKNNLSKEILIWIISLILLTVSIIFLYNILLNWGLVETKKLSIWNLPIVLGSLMGILMGIKKIVSKSWSMIYQNRGK